MANAIENIYVKYVTNKVAVAILILPIVLLFVLFGKATEDAVVMGLFMAIMQSTIWWVAGKRQAVNVAVTLSVCVLLIIVGIL